jgi:tight adherence protein B
MTRRSMVLVLIGSVLLSLAGGAGAVAQGEAPEPSVMRIRGVDPSAYPNVSVVISVPSEIDPASIQITENSSPSKVITARPLLGNGEGIDVVLAIDTSASVSGTPLQQAVAAAQLFVRSLPSGVGVGVLTFSGETRVLSPVSKDHESVISALASVTETQRGTRLYDGVEAAVGMFSGKAQRNIVLLTDGTDVGSTLSLSEAVAAAKDGAATVFTVGLEGTRTDFSGLETIAGETGGTFQLVTTADLAALYRDLATQLTRQYIVLYESRGPAGAQVTVGVKTPVGTDSAVVLLPRPRSAGETPHKGGPLWFGSWSLAAVLVLSFLTAFLLAVMILGGTYRSRRDRELTVRMSAPAWAQEEHQRQPEGPGAWVPGSLVSLGDAVAAAGGFNTSLDTKLERAGLPVTPGEVVGASFVLGFLGLVAGGLLLRSVPLALVVGALAALAPFLFVQVKMNRRLDLLHSQLPDVLMILASSMRAGHSFQQALDAVAKEVGEPGGTEFARVVAEVRLGRPFEESLTALAERVGTEEFKWAVMGINVQREVGGNLAEILDTLSETVREREAVRRQVKVLSAEGRLSVKILIVMPFLMAGYLTWVNRSYMRLLWTTRPGIIFMVIGAVLMLVGAIWARKTVEIDV